MPQPKPNQTALLADFLTVMSMWGSGEWPMPVVEAVAERADARDEAREARPDGS